MQSCLHFVKDRQIWGSDCLEGGVWDTVTSSTTPSQSWNPQRVAEQEDQKVESAWKRVSGLSFFLCFGFRVVVVIIFFLLFFLCVCLIVCLYICLFVLQYVSFEMLRFSTDVQELCPIACIHFHIDIPIVSRLVN